MFIKIVIIFAIAWTACVSYAESTIPDVIITNIAKATLPNNNDQQTLEKRIHAVRQFIVSNGGDVMYQNYLDEFGVGESGRACVSTDDVHSSRLGYYYLNGKLDSVSSIIGCFDYSSPAHALSVSNSNPTLRVQYALTHWDAYIFSGDKRYANHLLTIADHLISVSKNGQIQWTNKTIPAHGITNTPWISALTQSQATSVLLRAYQYTGSQKYRDAADMTYRWLTVSEDQGGLLSKDIGTWFEEYPTQSPNGNSSHVLNGTIFGAFGVWDYYRVTGDKSAKALFAQNISAIKANMNWYDLGYWTVYSHLNRVDTVNGIYMQFITLQMYSLGKITGDPYWTELGNKWSTAQRSSALFIHNIAEVFMSDPSQSKQ